MLVRDFLWEYPKFVMALVKRFSLFFLVLSGILSGFLLLAVVGVAISSRQENQLFDGTLKYGIVGNFDSVNPIEVGSSDAEQAASKLIYNSLITIDASGRISPELADTWAMSPDGREYLFFLKKGIKWHDNYEVTAKDVATTFDLLQSGDTGTVVGSIAKDVEVEVRGVYEVAFKLKQVNAAFLELLTVPIMPDHIYNGISYSRVLELGDSITPVGTGPYVYGGKNGDTVTLTANHKYFKGRPAINTIQFVIYPTYELAEAGFLSGEVQAISPIETSKVSRLQKVAESSPRVSVYPYIQSNNTRLLLFNMNKKEAIGYSAPIRQAFAKALNRQTLASLVPGAIPAYGPYSQTSEVYDSTVETLLSYTPSESNTLLEKEGWVYPYSGAPYRMKSDTELKLTLTFLDSETNRKVAESIRDQVERVGINLTLNGITSDLMTQSVLPQKEFEVLLFEIQSGIDPDQYGLWHSTQTTFPGLNLAGYNSKTIDALLEKGRLQTNRDKRIEIYKQFQSVIVKDAVAVFLYHPAYYAAFFDIIDRKLPTSLIDPSDRFDNIQTWKMVPGWRNWQTR